ncbi:MAG: arginase family protein [Gemmatimonadaceae bacterium]|nr:arginase family protein [Gloeobacterales cyanobacterium ES-bin-141]
MVAETAVQQSAKVVLIPVAYGEQGVGKAVQNLLEAALTIEPFDAELCCEPLAYGVDVMRFFWDEAPFANTEQAVGVVLDRQQFPIVLGGEHPLTVGPVRAAWKRYPDLAFVQVSAYPHRREATDGDPYGRHTLVSRLVERGIPVVQVGVRSLSREEVVRIAAPGQQQIFWDREFVTHSTAQGWDIGDVLAAIPQDRPLYLSIDLSGLDPAIAVASTHLEPGGLSWYPLMRLLRGVLARQVVACDITELSPSASDATHQLVARLLHKLIGYKFSNT